MPALDDKILQNFKYYFAVVFASRNINMNGYNSLDVIVCLLVIGISIYLGFACIIFQSAEWVIVLRDLHMIRVNWDPLPLLQLQ